MKFVAIDFETANCYRNSACSIGMVKYENGQIVDEYYSLIRPPYMVFDPINVEIHGITARDVLGACTFDVLWNRDIKKWIEDYPLVAHNASFDTSVLRNVLMFYNIYYEYLYYCCTLALARKTYQGLENFKLSTIANHLNIPLQHHHALDDARAAALILADISRIYNCDNLDSLCQCAGVKIKMV